VSAPTAPLWDAVARGRIEFREHVKKQDRLESAGPAFSQSCKVHDWQFGTGYTEENFDEGYIFASHGCRTLRRSMRPDRGV
jgi:hypothetical protein